MFPALQETADGSDTNSAEALSMAVVGDGELGVDIYDGTDGEQGWRRAAARPREIEDNCGRRSVDLVDSVNLKKIWDGSSLSDSTWRMRPGGPISAHI